MALSVGNEMATMNAVMGEFLQPMQYELDDMDIKHTCGAEFRLSWLNRDGQIWRWAHDMDRMECILTAWCMHERTVRYCPDRDTSLNYLRLGIDGMMLSRLRDSADIITIIKMELEAGWDDFKRHLETVAMPAWDRAIARALEDSLCNIRPNYLSGDWSAYA